MYRADKKEQDPKKEQPRCNKKRRKGRSARRRIKAMSSQVPGDLEFLDPT
jgi:hypothetical protein